MSPYFYMTKLDKSQGYNSATVALLWAIPKRDCQLIAKWGNCCLHFPCNEHLCLTSHFKNRCLPEIMCLFWNKGVPMNVTFSFFYVVHMITTRNIVLQVHYHITYVAEFQAFGSEHWKCKATCHAQYSTWLPSSWLLLQSGHDMLITSDTNH